MKLKDAHHIVKKMVAQANKKERTALKIACVCHAKRAGTERASRKIKQVDTNHALQIMWCMDMAGRASILSCLWTTDEVVRETK